MQSYAIICNQCRSRHKSPQGRVLNETPQLESNLGMTRNDLRKLLERSWKNNGQCDNLVLIAFAPCKATNVMKVDIVWYCHLDHEIPDEGELPRILSHHSWKCFDHNQSVIKSYDLIFFQCFREWFRSFEIDERKKQIDKCLDVKAWFRLQSPA